MLIWLDADACPRPVKDVVFKAAQSRKVKTIVVANQPLRIPPSEFISFQLVPAGFDVADNHIVTHLNAGDLVVTADIPLASLVVGKGAVALDPRGTVYSEANVSERLSMRDFMQDLRGGGLIQGGPASFDNRNKQAFASSFDRELTRALRK